ncbi:MAG: type I methionyl aminopeptidase [Spirochaetales bacterium]|nr:type I methionyl aminopeptidase [Spirochaetales bacterium]
MFIDNKRVPIKSPLDINRIRQACKIVESTLHYLKQFIKPGVSTGYLDKKAEKFIIKKGGIPDLKGYKGFPASICASVNNVAAHGIPSGYLLREGDIVSLDITLSFNGWHGDATWTYPVGNPTPDARRVIAAAWQACLAGIKAAAPGIPVGDIGWAITEAARSCGCSVIEDYVGHGIGRAMHEEPRIPNFGVKGRGFKLVPGMVFTIEPMVNLGGPEVVIGEDKWAILTCDNSLSAQFEQTIAVLKDSIEVLTFSQGNIFESLDYPIFL